MGCQGKASNDSFKLSDVWDSPLALICLSESSYSYFRCASQKITPWSSSQVHLKLEIKRMERRNTNFGGFGASAEITEFVYFRLTYQLRLRLCCRLDFQRKNTNIQVGK